MNASPDVSVVMSVYNGADRLHETMESILSQERVSLEFIIVNDGSTDGSATILDCYANRDSRVQVLHQENQGLTLALIGGCAAARGEYIARQDVGDLSFSCRLVRQVSFLIEHPEAVMVACGTRVVGPLEEPLYETSQCGAELHEGLLDIRRIRGPSHHGATMFRRTSYEAAGGYRAQFIVAQDLDLWLRLAELGSCLAIPDVLYQAILLENSISAQRRSQQIRMARMATECAALRRQGFTDEGLLARGLEEGREIPLIPRVSGRLQAAKFYYFIARSLQRTEPERAMDYYRKSLGAWLLYPKAWLALLLCHTR